ncbi:NAD-dependent epimerase/dehydratase family protein [Rhodococcus opacus]|uniref:NAD-dependent epimerase/dehydratase family protein n=1 Tax=Rhodococcus opacus TaxID=37919 RepID=UPI001C478698|nr:NAD(P)-dependent oxidoreductase [Rhodococcus opacus]MBV6756690.1 NAD(P)-dependent oxidoreductase [Rhodococcus opacus]
MKALVIGGTGPTGPLIVQGLQERGYHVVMLNRGTRRLPEEVTGVEHIRADPHFAETLGLALADLRFDLVIAAYGRLRVMPAILRECTQRVISIGGTAFTDLDGRPADETAPRQMRNTLVQKIVETETAILEAHRRGDFNLTHMRYPNVWGPRQLAPREWSVVRRVLDGRPFIPVIDGGLTLESKAFADNAAHAVLLAVDQPDRASGQIYNVADECTPPDAVRARDLARALGSEIEYLSLPETMSGPAAFWGIARDMNFSREGRPPHAHHQIIDIGKLKTELGYRDAVPYEVAAERTARWYRDHPLERGGAAEAQLGDPFDYASEDAYAAAVALFRRTVSSIAFPGIEYIHPYSHPRSPQS